MRLLVNHEALRAIREARRLPAQQVARDVEISPQYLCDIEAGRRNPRAEVIARLAEILDVPVGAITHRVVAA
jgi:transcriptional regulator with XRE-family HTH domain